MLIHQPHSLSKSLIKRTHSGPSKKSINNAVPNLGLPNSEVTVSSAIIPTKTRPAIPDGVEDY